MVQHHVEDAGQVEDVQRHLQRERDGQDGEDREERDLDEVAEPGDADVLAVLDAHTGTVQLGGIKARAPADTLLLIQRQALVQGRHGADAAQLEHPPDHHLHAQEHIAQPGQDRDDEQDAERDAVGDLVAQLDLPQEALVGEGMPDEESQEEGRDQQVHHPVGDEDDAHDHDDQAQHQDGTVELERRADRIRIQPYQHGEQDDRSERGIEREQAGGHLEEIVVQHGRREPDGQRKEQEAAEDGQAGQAKGEILGLHRLDEAAEHPDDRDTQQRSHANEQEHEEHEAGDDGAAPFAVIQLSVGRPDAGVFLLGVLEGAFRV